MTIKLNVGLIQTTGAQFQQTHESGRLRGREDELGDGGRQALQVSGDQLSAVISAVENEKLVFF